LLQIVVAGPNLHDYGLLVIVNHLAVEYPLSRDGPTDLWGWSARRQARTVDTAYWEDGVEILTVLLREGARNADDLDHRVAVPSRGLDVGGRKYAVEVRQGRKSHGGTEFQPESGGMSFRNE
jgi:hypothetical protein